jgi:hypothetical protein
MKRLYFLAFLALILHSCYQPAQKPEFDMALVLPADTMVAVITDLHLAESMVNVEQKKNKSITDFPEQFLKTVVEKHGITTESLDESIRYYSYNTVLMDEIYEKVIMNLNMMEGEILNLQPKPESSPGKDSAAVE